MKKVLMALSIVAVFSMALYANAYASSMEDESSQGQQSVRMIAPFETPGSTSTPSGGFGYYGADFHGAPVGTSEAEIQSRYGQAPAMTEEGQPYYGEYLGPGSTTPSSGGFGYYGAQHFSEVQTPEEEMQTRYGQAPAAMEEEGASRLFESTPGSTSPPSGGFGYY